MVVPVLALIGLLVGVALDALIVRLARPEDEAPGDEVEEPSAVARRLQGEAGSAGLALEGPDRRPSGRPRRLLVMGATSALFAMAALRFDDVSHLAIVTAYISVLIVCAGTDLLVFRVPNVVTYPAAIGALAVAAAMPDANVMDAIAGGLLAGVVLFVPALITGGHGMGMGDVKLAAFAGLALGVTNIVPALLFMALGGGAAALLLLVTGARKRGEPIPYAPFISAGALATLLWHGSAFAQLT